MRWFTIRLLAVWVLFIAIIGAVIAISRQQPVPSHVAIFHLKDCQLPCWIGIIPGKSTIHDAREQIKRVYGDLQKYKLLDDGSNQFTVVNKADGFALTMNLNIEDFNYTHSKDTDPITTIWFTSASKDPSLAEMISSMSSPTYLVQDEAVLNLIFQNSSVAIGIVYAHCEALDLQSFNLKIVAQLPDKADLIVNSYKIHAWRGIRTCYRMDQP